MKLHVHVLQHHTRWLTRPNHHCLLGVAWLELLMHASQKASRVTLACASRQSEDEASNDVAHDGDDHDDNEPEGDESGGEADEGEEEEEDDDDVWDPQHATPWRTRTGRRSRAGSSRPSGMGRSLSSAMEMVSLHLGDS